MSTIDDHAGVVLKPQYHQFGRLYTHHFVMRSIFPPPLTVANILTWLIMEIAATGMFEKTNCLIVIFSPVFASALNGIVEIHSYDLRDLIVTRLVHSYHPLPFKCEFPFQRPVMWDCKKCNVQSIYNQYLGTLSFDYIHQRRTPYGKLAHFLSKITPPKSYKRGLKLLRIYRVILDHCEKNNLISAESYRMSIINTDDSLFQIFGVRKVHSMDLPFLILQNSRPFVRNSLLPFPKNVC